MLLTGVLITALLALVLVARRGRDRLDLPGSTNRGSSNHGSTNHGSTNHVAAETVLGEIY